MAGNSNSGRRPGGRDFGPRVRSIVDRVLERLEANGDVDRLLTQAFEDDFPGTLRAVAAYAPKIIDATVSGAKLEDFVLGKVQDQQNDSSEADNIH